MFFSVVIPLYNKEATVDRALRSVLSQTHQDFEIVVINDGSTDDGPEVARQVKDARLRIIGQQNAGVAAARNRGIREARAEFVAFLDADDEWDPKHLEVLSHLRSLYPCCDVLATGYRLARGNAARPVILRGLRAGWEGELEHYFRLAANSEPPLHSSSVAVRREAALSVGGFECGVVSGEDLLMWAKLAAKYRIAYSVAPTATFWLDPSHYFEKFPQTRRQTQIEDGVGLQLRTIYRSESQHTVRRDLRRYIALWYRMRAGTLLLTGHRTQSLHALFSSVKFHPPQPKLMVYGLLAVLPKSVALRTFRAFSASAQI